MEKGKLRMNVMMCRKVKDDSQPSPLRSFDAGLLRSCPWYAYRYETRSRRLEIFLEWGITFGQLKSLPL
jgi:hypothetical protein